MPPEFAQYHRHVKLLTDQLANYRSICYIPTISSRLLTRLRPIPEFTDTTDTDTLDLHQYRYRVPSTDTGSDVTAATTSRFMLLCMSTEQACVVHVCMKIL